MKYKLYPFLYILMLRHTLYFFSDLVLRLQVNASDTKKTRQVK